MELSEILLAATEAAAAAVYPLVGKKRKEDADAAAVRAIRETLGEAAISGEVVIGEGEMDEAPMLYVGEKVGKGGPAIDIAVDPVEGTDLVANGQGGASCTLAAGPKGSLLKAPDMYMDKMAAGREGVGRLSLQVGLEENIKALASALHRPAGTLVVVMLDRPRHKELMESVLRAGARLCLIPAGDLVPSLLPCFPGSGVDLVVGSGGAPEAVISAAAIRAMGGFFEGRLLPEDDEDRRRMEALGLDEGVMGLERLVNTDEPAFAASAVTGGWTLSPARAEQRWLWVDSLAVSGTGSGRVRRVSSRRPI